MTDRKERETFYNRTVEDVEKHFSTDRGRGLSSDAIPKKRREYGQNNIYRAVTAKKSRLIPTDFAALLLLAAIFIAIIFEVPIASGTMVAMLIINYGAALITYYKAHKVLDGMTDYSLPTAKVLRNGKPVLMEMRLLVPGDIIFLSAGDVVPADCRLFSTEGLFINEGMVTGVQSSVMKDAQYENYAISLPLEKMENMAFATTIVTAGTGRGIVVATGRDTEAVRRDKVKPLNTHENLNILMALKKYCSVWSLAMLLLVFFITVVDLFFAGNTGVFDVFLTGISLAVAAMSELYVAFGYIIVGCGIFSAMKRRRDVNVGALIKNAQKLEELKNVSVLIIPKDGVITSSHCTVDKIYTGRTLYSAADADRLDKIRPTVLAGVISTGIYGTGLMSLNKNSRRITPEEEALIAAAETLSLYNSRIDRSHPIIEHRGAGGASKFETTLTVDSDKSYMAVSRGDPEAILDACIAYTENGRIFNMTTEDKLEFLGVAESLTRSSYRVVALATGVTGYNNLNRIGSVQSGLTFEGFIAIKEPLAPEVVRTIARCKNAGIRVIMATDKPRENDKFIAMSVGIIDSEKGILTPHDAEGMNPDVLRTNLPLYNMYTGLTATKMSEIVKMMQADGETVGYLGTGIGGVLLIKRADVGFAQSTTISPRSKRGGIDLRSRKSGAYSSISGENVFDSEALKLVSDVVISEATDDGRGGFNAVVSALEYSRTIYRNLIRMVRYLTTAQLARVFITVGSLIMGVKALTPVQLIFGGLMVDFAAIVASAFAKPSYNALTLKDKAEDSLKNPISMNLSSALFALFSAVTILAISPVLNLVNTGMAAAEFTTAAFITFTICQLITFAELSSQRSLFLPGIRISTSYLLFAVGVVGFLTVALLSPAVGAVFGIVRLSLPTVICIAVVSALNFAVNEIYKLILKQDKKQVRIDKESTL